MARRPSMEDLRGVPFVGTTLAELFESIGLNLDELPHIIPDDVGDERFQQMLVEHLKTKGWSEEDLRRPLDDND